MVVHAWEVKQKAEVQVRPWLHSESEECLGHGRHCPTNNCLVTQASSPIFTLEAEAGRLPSTGGQSMVISKPV